MHTSLQNRSESRSEQDWFSTRHLSDSRAVFELLRARLRARIAGLVARTRKALYEAMRPRPSLLGGLLVDLTRSRKQLIKENALLRQQLIVAARGVKQPKARPHERGLMVLLASTLPHWRKRPLALEA